ncbi:hypothetical protein AB0G86_45710, partial [Streptomyces scabiei]|uniref:hypothetical protein n=1 Tax=Streptomyces scabiei TaxID=1930 RepID=UPI0033EEC795
MEWPEANSITTRRRRAIRAGTRETSLRVFGCRRQSEAAVYLGAACAATVAFLVLLTAPRRFPVL